MGRDILGAIDQEDLALGGIRFERRSVLIELSGMALMFLELMYVEPQLTLTCSLPPNGGYSRGSNKTFSVPWFID